MDSYHPPQQGLSIRKLKLELIKIDFFLNQINEQKEFNKIFHLSLGEGGTVFSGSVQTSHLSAPPGRSLHLESATRSLEVAAPHGVALESRAGTIKAECLNDFILQSTGGVVSFSN